MKKLSLIFVLTIFLIPSFANAQVMIGPGPLNPMGGISPIKIGFVHEGSLAITAFSGDAQQDFPAGASLYYSGLIRPTPHFAYGLHTGAGSMNSFDGSSQVHVGFVGGEGRLYLPIDRFLDLWASASIGVGFIHEMFDPGDGYLQDGDTFLRPSVAFGAGVDYYISSEISFGGYVRMYRMLYSDNQNVEKDDDQIKVQQYYGVLGNIGFSISLHY